MPLPVAHSLLSAGVFALYKNDVPVRQDKWWIALFIFIGLFPDIDFITVPFTGFGSHRGFTHSFAFAFAVTAFIYLIIRIWKQDAPIRLWPFFLLTMSLHPVCDYFTYDYLVERGGVKLFFPFSNEYYQSPVPIFMGIELRYLRTIFSTHTLLAVLYETVLSGMVLTAVLYLKRGALSVRDKAE